MDSFQITCLLSRTILVRQMEEREINRETRSFKADGELRARVTFLCAEKPTWSTRFPSDPPAARQRLALVLACPRCQEARRLTLSIMENVRGGEPLGGADKSVNTDAARSWDLLARGREGSDHPLGCGPRLKTPAKTLVLQPGPRPAWPGHVSDWSWRHGRKTFLGRGLLRVPARHSRL